MGAMGPISVQPKSNFVHLPPHTHTHSHTHHIRFYDNIYYMIKLSYFAKDLRTLRGPTTVALYNDDVTVVATTDCTTMTLYTVVARMQSYW